MQVNNKLSDFDIRWSLEVIMQSWTDNDVQNLIYDIKYVLNQLGEMEKLAELNNYIIQDDKGYYYNNNGYIQTLEIGNLQEITYYMIKKLLLKLEDADAED